MKKIKTILFTLFIILGAFVVSILLRQNGDFFSKFSLLKPAQNTLNSQFLGTENSPTLPGISCEKKSWNEGDSQFVDFVLVSKGDQINNVSFFGNFMQRRDISAEYRLGLLRTYGDISIGQPNSEKIKFSIDYGADTLTYTQSLFFGGAEYKCPPLVLTDLEDDMVSSESCDVLYAELDPSEARGITCTGTRSFVVEQDISNMALTSTAGYDTFVASIGSAMNPSAFAQVSPPTTEYKEKKNILKRFGGGIVNGVKGCGRILVKSGKSIIMIGMFPLKLCDATLNALTDQISKVNPKLGKLFRIGTDISLTAVTGGGYAIAAQIGTVGGTVERMVIDKNDPATALINELLAKKSSCPLQCAKEEGKKFKNIWTNKK